jgi:hypothetical protein
MEEQQSRKRTWIVIALITLVIILLVVFVDIGAVLDTLRGVNLELLILGGIILLGGLILISVRLLYLLGNEVGFLKVLNADGISYMVRMFTPIFLPVLRVATLTATTPLTVTQATPAIMAIRLSEITMRLIALILAAILISKSEITSGWIILWIILISGIFILLIRVSSHAEDYLPRLTTWLGRIPRVEEERIKGPINNLGKSLATTGTTRRLLVSLLISLVMWFCFLFFYAIMFEALDFGFNLEESLALSAALLVILPPSTPAMIVVYQAIMVVFLIPFRIADTSELVAYAVLVFTMQLVFWTILGIWGLRRTKLKLKDVIRMPKSIPEDQNQDD